MAEFRILWIKEARKTRIKPEGAPIFKGTVVAYAGQQTYVEPTSIEQISERYQKLIMPDREPEPPRDPETAKEDEGDKKEEKAKKKPKKKKSKSKKSS